MPVRDEETGEELLTPEEASKELGLSRSTMRVQTFRGRLRVKRLSERVVLYPRSAIEEYKRDRLGQPPGPRRGKG
jgi:predicted DNA-binding transcriptional regulator AlpA